MKNLLVLLLVSFVVPVFSQEVKNLEYPKYQATDTIVQHKAYTLKWCPGYCQAAWVAYELTKAETNNQFERNNKFIPDPLIKTSTDFEADYSGSGFDRGHLAPAADMSSTKPTMEESFYFSNMSPQVPNFNRGIWKQLEELVRDWAIENGNIYVVTGPVLSDSLTRMGKHQIAVPEYYYKVILVSNSTATKGIGFLLPNAKSTEKLQTFAVSIDSVESVTGLDFYHQLPDKTELAVEKDACLSCWAWNSNETASHSTTSKNAPKETTTAKPTTTAKAVQCSAIKKSGKRCNNKTTNKSGLCSAHEKKS